MSIVENGNTVAVHYTGTLNDGTEFDSSRNKEPLMFKVGSGKVIPGFETAVMGMTEGETKTITIPCQEAYGPEQPDAFQVVSRKQFNTDFHPEIGQVVTGETDAGQKFHAVVTDMDEDNISLNFNHPLAGKDLSFEIKLESIISGV